MSTSPQPPAAADVAVPRDWLDPARIAEFSKLPVGALFPPGLQLSPRDRLLIGMAESVREHGFRGTSVADVVRRARTSRRTFYEHFADREACFLALFDLSNAIFVARITTSLDPTKPWREQVGDAIDVYVDVVTSEPQISIAFAREIGALGVAGAERQRQELESFARWLVELVASVGVATGEPLRMDLNTALLITGGLRESVPYSLELGLDLAPLAAATKALIVRAIEDGLDPAA